jgi:predicted TIM-barrel fold metal-dependent hydrolase
MIIDADAHVIETDSTWDFIADAEDLPSRPVVAHGVDAEGNDQHYWIIDGKARPGVLGNVGSMFPKGARELLDVPARLRHMDELGVDVHVIYPSLLSPTTDRPATELALSHGYNRQLANAWEQSRDRLRWAAVLPLMSMDKAIDEVRWARDHGACAVFIRSIEGDRQIIDPYFFPLYAEAEKLDLPICVHASIGNQTLADILGQGVDQGSFLRFKMTVVAAFHQLVLNRVPEQFPTLRWGFVETSSAWLPFVIHDLRRRAKRRGIPLPQNILKENRMYVACEADDDLPFILNYAGEDNLVIGTDYSHADITTEMDAITHLQERTDLEPRIVDKILDANPRALYAL